jgi:hypothetical protein
LFTVVITTRSCVPPSTCTRGYYQRLRIKLVVDHPLEQLRQHIHLRMRHRSEQHASRYSRRQKETLNRSKTENSH